MPRCTTSRAPLALTSPASDNAGEMTTTSTPPAAAPATASTWRSSRSANATRSSGASTPLRRVLAAANPRWGTMIRVVTG